MATVSTKGLKILLQKAEATEISLTPTDISKAAPAVITVTNTLADGDVVTVTNTGFEELDGHTFIVANASGSEFSLLGSDTTASTGTLAGSPTMSAYEMSDFQEVCAYSIGIDANAPSTVSTATFCNLAASVPSSVQELGNISLALYHDPKAMGYQELAKAEVDGVQRLLLVKFPQDGGTLVAAGTVSSLNISDIPLDGAAAWSATFALAGKPELRY